MPEIGLAHGRALQFGPIQPRSLQIGLEQVRLDQDRPAEIGFREGCHGQPARGKVSARQTRPIHLAATQVDRLQAGAIDLDAGQVHRAGVGDGVGVFNLGAQGAGSPAGRLHADNLDAAELIAELQRL